jgi:hypothetical protein
VVRIQSPFTSGSVGGVDGHPRCSLRCCAWRDTTATTGAELGPPAWTAEQWATRRSGSLSRVFTGRVVAHTSLPTEQDPGPWTSTGVGRRLGYR